MRQALATLVALALSAPALAEPVHPIVGVWVTDEQAEVTVAPCDAGYCGYLSRIIIPEDRMANTGKKAADIDIASLTDVNNKDPLLKQRPLLGLEMLTLDTALSANAFEGDIYNPEDGNIYYGKLELIDRHQVKLTGCALVVLCQSQSWFRAPKENPPPIPAELIRRP